jgi:hypothetical protein
MRYITLLFLVSGAANAQQQLDYPYHHEIVITSSHDLLSWCESEARAHFSATGFATYQWTGRHHVSGDTLYAEGKLRVGEKDVSVSCHVAKGLHERHAAIKFGEE